MSSEEHKEDDRVYESNKFSSFIKLIINSLYLLQEYSPYYYIVYLMIIMLYI